MYSPIETVRIVSLAIKDRIENLPSGYRYLAARIPIVCPSHLFTRLSVESIEFKETTSSLIVRHESSKLPEKLRCSEVVNQTPAEEFCCFFAEVENLEVSVSVRFALLQETQKANNNRVKFFINKINVR